MTSNLPPEFLKKLSEVTGKRSRIVVEHILKHGYISTEDLNNYGYNHPPRAAKDVRDQGIPLETFNVTSSDGKSIAAYRFGDPSEVVEGRIGGRSIFSKKFKEVLYTESNGRCAICNGQFESRELQIDHRIPYEISGDNDYSEEDTSSYMLLCGSCNRTKSWSCENCGNWKVKDRSVCTTCYWSNPIAYSHIALREIRRSDIIWEEEEVKVFDKAKEQATRADMSLTQYLKKLIRDTLGSLRMFLSTLRF